MKKVLLVGESWEVFSIHLKGFDAFFTTKYDEGPNGSSRRWRKAATRWITSPTTTPPAKCPPISLN